MNAKHLLKMFLTITLLVMVTACGGGATPEPPAEVASDDSAPAEAPVEAEAPAAGFTPSSKCIVPDVVGLDIAVAESNLAGPGLQPVKDFRHDESVAENAIISQEPPAGTTLEPCEGDVVIVVSLGPVPVPTETPGPTETPTAPPDETATPSPDETPTPPPVETTIAVTDTATSAPSGTLPPGEWAVKAFNTDDASAIIVNGQLVGASTYHQSRDTDWISINDHLVPGENLVTFANWNGGGGLAWGFSVRRDETVIWGAEGNTGQNNSLNYAQTVAIKPDGTVEPVPPDTSAYPTLSDAWSIRMRYTADVAVVLVNGVAVVGNWSNDTGWIEITGLLRADQDNTISMYVWNFDADYSWRISIRKEDTTVWEQEDNGSGLQGVVFSQEATITKDGEVLYPQATGNMEEHEWAVKAFDTDDASILIVNNQLVGASTYHKSRDTDWISINELLVPGENMVTFANWNGGGGVAWGFSIRRDETVIWGAEGNTGQNNSLNYAQTVAIKPDGTVEPVPPDTSAYPTLSNAWSVRMRETADVGVVLVNGVAVAGNWSRDTDWIDITGLLRADQDNTIEMYVWNFDADYSWRISIRKEETTVWESERSGSGSPGVVLSDSVTITANGELQQ